MDMLFSPRFKGEPYLRTVPRVHLRCSRVIVNRHLQPYQCVFSFFFPQSATANRFPRERFDTLPRAHSSSKRKNTYSDTRYESASYLVIHDFRWENRKK